MALTVAKTKVLVKRDQFFRIFFFILRSGGIAIGKKKEIWRFWRDFLQDQNVRNSGNFQKTGITAIGTDYNMPDKYVISTSQVEKQMHAIKISNKASSPDDTPNWILKDFAECVSDPVCALFNSSICQGHMLQMWKSAVVCPLAKVPSLSAIEKHLRPTSPTPTLLKVLEWHIVGWVMNTARDVIDDHQFTSLCGSSTIHVLVELVHLWQKALNIPGHHMHLLLLDFSKAFNWVDHSLLLEKFGNLGLSDFLVCWLMSFSCQQDEGSNWAPHSLRATINAGVPQGTVLGPVGFLVHINGLHTTCNSTKYMDDTTFWESCSVDCSDSLLQMATDQAWVVQEPHEDQPRQNKNHGNYIHSHTPRHLPSVHERRAPLECDNV